MDAFLLETDLAAGLDPRRDLAADLAVQRWKLCLPAQDRHGIRDLRRCVQIQPVPRVIPVGIDIGFGDVVYPDAVKMEFPVILDMEPPKVNAYSLESSIAEKLEAIIHNG